MSNLTVISEKAVLPFIEPKKHEIIALIGKDNLTREMSFAIQAANSSSYLATATPQSVAKAVFNVAITGLSLNPVMKLAYITPRKINNVVEAVLMPSYMGLCKLTTDTGSVIKVEARLVYAGEKFEVAYGTQTNLIHTPTFGGRKDANIIAAYAIATLHDNSTQFEVMDIEEIHGIRERSDGYRSFKNGKVTSCIWVSDYGEMCKKTVIKRLIKYLPKSVRNAAWEKVMTAIDIDNKEYPATHQQVAYIENLIGNSTFDERKRQSFMDRLGELSQSEADEIIEELNMNQLAEQDRQQMSMTDSKNAVKNTIG